VGSSVEDSPVTAKWWAGDLNEPLHESMLKYFLSSAAVAWTRARNWSNYDAFLTQTSVTALGALVALDSNKPHYWWIREFGDLDHNLEYPLQISQMGALFKDLSTQVITNSKAVKRHFYGDSEEDVIVIEPTPRSSKPTSITKPKVPHVSLVGAINPGKGGDVFVVALSKLKERGFSFTASLRGPGRQDRLLELRDLIESTGLEKVVSLDQTMTTLEELYSETSIVVVASRNEAFGRVPFEATGFNCAIVYSRSGGLLEYMIDGVTGLSFTPNDSSELAEKLEMLLLDTELLDRLISGAKEVLLSEERHRISLEKLTEVFIKRKVPHRQSVLQQIIKSELTERDSLTTERDSLTTERDSLITERDSLITERDSLITERDSLITERDSLINSNSWKLTKPFRALSEVLRKISDR
jgi:glycosyltransferase involved in cell wall biosynthesis